MIFNAVLIYFMFIKFIISLQITDNDSSYFIKIKANEFLTELNSIKLNKNREESFDICNKNNILMEPQTFQNNNFIFNYSLLDSDEKQLVELAKFIEERFSISYDNFLDDCFLQYEWKSILYCLFKDKKLTPEYLYSLNEYNRWLVNNGLSYLKIEVYNFTDLSNITYDLDKYKGPDNLFFKLLQKVHELRNIMHEYNKTGKALNICLTDNEIYLTDNEIYLTDNEMYLTGKEIGKIYGYFYGCFLLFRNLLEKEMEPCHDDYPFDNFKRKIQECKCNSCKKYKPLNAYLFHLRNLFDIPPQYFDNYLYFNDIKYKYKVCENINNKFFGLLNEFKEIVSN
ncbi:hypothetical protein EHP00_1070 [Ecytonucleospora hepatopenaei]|uniref:Protein kinase domain-containing protein n=1 Tax=Ecytonucleospora hepatopenaei TaxID=646526 RepID=A0A1W0E576_9MICR|nr:hypothetical protein EHP00_1070 [Ecytonucleospora hepatopenaei]